MMGTGCYCGYCIGHPGLKEHLEKEHGDMLEYHSPVPEYSVSYDENNQWYGCRFCDSKEHYTSLHKHFFENNRCTECGYEKAALSLKGDMNLDGVVDMKDAAMLQRHVLKIDIVEDEATLAVCELTGDGIVDMKDAAKLTRYVIKVIDSLD